MADYLPHSDSGLGQWSCRFAAVVEADPEGYGLSVAQATAYRAAQTAFAQALAVINDPTTRTPVAITAKNRLRKELIAQSRRCAAVVQAYEGTTDVMRLRLGLTIRKRRARMAGVPLDRPEVRVVAVESAIGDRVKLRVRASDGGGRPTTARGYTLYSYIGDKVPTALAQWSFEGNGVEQKRTVTLPEDVPAGSMVHFVAHWFNARMQPGPLGPVVTTRVAGRRAVQPGVGEVEVPGVGVALAA